MEIKPETRAGTLPIGLSGVLFTAPSGVLTKISTIIVVNTGGGFAGFVNIFYRHGPGSTPVAIFPVAYSVAIGGSAQESDTLFLWPQDTIEGFSTGSTVDYLISAIALG